MPEYVIIGGLCSPLLFFILGVGFRLLDNSAAIFLSNEILVNSAYVSTGVIRSQMGITEKPEIRKGLVKALFFRRLHDFFMLLMVISIPIVCLYVFFK